MSTAISLSAVCAFAAFCLLLGSSNAQTGEVRIMSSGEARSSAGGTTSIGGSGFGEVTTSTSPTIQGSVSAEASEASSSSAQTRATIRTDTGSTSISISTSSDEDGETVISDSSQGQTSIQISTSSSSDEPEPEAEPEAESGATEMNAPAPESSPSPPTDPAPEMTPSPPTDPAPLVTPPPAPVVAPQVMPPPTEILPPPPFSVQPSFPPPAPISKDAATEIQEKYGIDIFDMRECRGAADWKCCDVQDFIEKDSSTFCGCATSFRLGGLDPGFCRWERIHNDPSIWMETRDGVPDAFKFCRCSNSGYKPCDGLTKRECCDSYMGLDTCQCNGTLCNYKKVQENPLVWEDQFIAEGRRCKCDF